MGSLRLIFRSLAGTPVFSAVAILSLALGIGANTAIFSLIDQLLLQSLPVKNPQELVYLYHPGPTQGRATSDERGSPSFSYPMFKELQKQQTPFEGLAASFSTAASLSYNNAAQVGSARLVSGNYFDLLGVKPALERLIGEDDDRKPGDSPVAVLSYDYWSTRFGSDPSVLNQKLIVSGTPMTIVGVSQKDFNGEKQADYPDVFVPMTMKAQMTPGWDGLNDRKDYWVPLLARLKPGVTLQRAETEINVAYRAQLEQDLQLLTSPSPSFLERFRAKKVLLKAGAGGRGEVQRQAHDPLMLLMGVTILVLMLACANVANLQLARSAGRVREIAVRLALGASRARLVRQLLIESCVISVTGGLLGLGVAKPTLQFVLSRIPNFAGGHKLFSTDLDVRVLLFSLGISVLTGLLFGLYPALQATNPDLAPTLKDEGGRSTGTGAASRFRQILVTAQIAISLLLLISAGLFTRSLVNVSSIDLGIQTDHLLLFSVAPKLNQYDDARTRTFHEQLQERLASIPGVRLATAADVPVVGGNSRSSTIKVEGYVAAPDEDSSASVSSVGPDYFRTMGMPLISGREIGLSDNAAAPKVAVVNQAFVRHFFGDREPLGRHITAGRGGSTTDTMEIVGVVKDARYSGMKEAPPPVFYPSYRQNAAQGSMFFYVRTALPPEQVAGAVRQQVAALDPNIPVRGLKTMEAQIEENMFEERIMSSLTAMFAGLATVLAAVGLYGVLAFNVARRTREIGIRMALGADASRVRGVILREVGIMLGIGLAVGAAGALATGSLVQSILYGLNARDPLVYVAAAAMLGAISLVAAYIPARSATAVDPMVALRYE